MADSPDGASGQPLIEFVFCPAEQFNQRDVIQVVANMEIVFLCWLGKFVPGTDQLAVVTAIDTVAHEGAQFDWNGTRVFDGEVGNTASGIQFIGRDDGLGGTCG